MYVHYLSLYCILFRRFLIFKINIALQLTKLLLKKVTTTATAATTTTTTTTKLLLTRNSLRAKLLSISVTHTHLYESNVRCPAVMSRMATV